MTKQISALLAAAIAMGASSAVLAQGAPAMDRSERGLSGQRVPNGGPSVSQKAGSEAKGGAQGSRGTTTTGSIVQDGRMPVEAPRR